MLSHFVPGVLLPVAACLVWVDSVAGQQPTLLYPEGGVMSLAFSPDGKFLATGVSNPSNPRDPVVVWDAATGKQVKVLKEHHRFVEHLHWGEDNTLLALCTSSHPDKRGTAIATWWSLPEGKVKKTLEIPEVGHIYALAPDGKHLVAAAEFPSKYVEVWEVDTGKRAALLEVCTYHISKAAFAADGKTLVTAGRKGQVKIWDAKTFAEKRVIKAHGGVGQLAVTPTADRVVTFSTDGKSWLIQSWDVADPKAKPVEAWALFEPHVFAPDGVTVACHGRLFEFKNTMVLWDARAGKVTAKLEVTTPLSEPKIMLFSPDGTRLAVDTGTSPFLIFTLPPKDKAKPPAR